MKDVESKQVDTQDEISDSRREFVKKAVYVAPAILTLRAAPAYAKNGSDKVHPQHPEHPDHP